MDKVIEILNRFDDDAIKYCVLRNFEFASGKNIDGDVDVLVRSQDKEEIHRILTTHDFYPFEGDTTRQTRYRGYHSEGREIITIDLYWNAPTYNGLPILDGKRVLKNRRRHEGIWIPSKEDYFVGLTFHSALNKGDYREKYRRELNRIRKNVNEKKVRDHARSQFGPMGDWTINQSLKGEYDAIITKKWEIVQAGLRQSPVTVLTLVWNLFVLREIVRPSKSLFSRLIPGIPTVAIIGPDGVGKSTAVSGITEALIDMEWKTKSVKLGVHSGVSPLFRSVRRIYNRITQRQLQSVERSKGKMELHSKSSSWKAAVLLIDWLGRYIKSQWGHPDVIIADRYFHEIIVYTKPGPVRWLFNPLTPTIGLVLDDDLDALAARSEYDRDSVKQFRNELNELNWPTVDVKDNPSDTVDRLLEKIVPEILRVFSEERSSQ